LIACQLTGGRRSKRQKIQEASENSQQSDTAACQDGPRHEMTSRALWDGLYRCVINPLRKS